MSENPTYYWTYELDGEVSDMEGMSKEEAQQAAQDKFGQICEDAGISQAQDDIELIRFHYDYYGERVIAERVESGVEYERGRSMCDEHNTYHNLI